MNSSLKKYFINQDYFKAWTHNMAYTLGLWYSNGYIYEGQFFDITLRAKDKFILKQIAKDIGYIRELVDPADQQLVRMNFSCVVICNDIISLTGINKDQIPIIPKEYLPDFIRGFFDGNGVITRLKNNRINCTFTYKNRKFLEQLHEILKEEAGVIGGSYDDSCYSLKFGKKDTLKIGEYLYKDNPELFLLRKRNKFY